MPHLVVGGHICIHTGGGKVMLMFYLDFNKHIKCILSVNRVMVIAQYLLHADVFM